MLNSFFVQQSFSQVQTQTPVTLQLHASVGGYYESLPVDYHSNPNKKYPLLIFVHGSGERGNGSQAQLPKVTANGPPKLIKQGKFPTSFTVGGKQYSFIVICPQFVGTSGSNAAMSAVLNHCLKTYRVDEQHMYVTGLSMGGLITYNYMGAYKATSDKFAAALFVCPGATSNEGRAGNIASANLPVWVTNNDEDPSAKVAKAILVVDMINAHVPAPTPKAKLTVFKSKSHDAWSKTYDPAFKEDGMNVYEWMLQYSRGGAVTPLPPVANAGTDQTITLPANSVTLDGSKSTAPSGSIASYAWTKVSGPSGGNITSAGSAKTAVTSLLEGTYQFQLKITDNKGGTATASVKVIVKPAPLPPVADAGVAQTITLPTNSVTLNGSKSTAPSGSIASYAWTKVSGPAGSTFANASSVSTTVNGLVEGVYVFQLKITDNISATATATVTVTVNAAPIPPVAQAGNDQIIELPQNSVTLDGSKSTASSGSIKTYQWTKISGPSGGNISNAGQAKTDVINLLEGTYEFELKVTDNAGLSSAAVVTITVKPAPAPPVANAGTDQTITLPVSSVVLNGSGSTAAGTITGYAWTKVTGPAGETIEEPGEVSTTISGLVKGVYKFQLKVTDNKGAASTAIVTVTVKPGAPPVANAGADQTIQLPENSVTLDGSISTAPSGNIQSYKWRKISGPAKGTILSDISAVTTVGDLEAGVYEFELSVVDNAGVSGIDIVKITVEAAAAPPVANAGDNQTITLPVNNVTLDGSSSTAASGVISSYAWIKTSGPGGAVIESPSGISTVISGLTEGIYEFELKVTDNNGATGASKVVVTVMPAPLPPVADAGTAQTVTLPVNSVILDGSSSFASSGTITAYTWAKVSGPTGETIVNPGAASTTVNGLTEGIYEFELEVTDNAGESATATVTITVKAAPLPPVANPGNDITISLPDNSITLDGSASTAPEGNISSYTWTKVSGPEGETIAEAANVITAVSDLQEGTYKFELKVTDNNGNTDEAIVTVTVNAQPLPPVAHAGAAQTITLPENTVLLDGSASTAPAGTITGYEWTKLSGPASEVITTPENATTNVSNLSEGVYKFQLTVTDNNNAVSTATVIVTVKAAPVPPVANAGSAVTITLPRDSVTLDGSKSTAEAGISSYEWSKVSGPSGAVIQQPANGVTTVNGLKKGTYKFQLIITDNNGITSTASVTITVKDTPAPPVANAGASQTITLPVNTVRLDGSASAAPSGSIANFEWTKLSGPAQGNIEEPANAVTDVSGLEEGVYVFQLSVTDNNSAVSTASVTITVKAAPAAPVADAGNSATITLPENAVILDGSKSTSESGISSYTWSKISGPDDFTIADPASAVSTVTGLTEGIYEFELKVTDVNDITSTAIVTITVKAAPLLPVANVANESQIITLPDNAVTLDGSSSVAGSGNISGYSWIKVSGPAAGVITDADKATTTVTGLAEGIYKFELTVTDENGLFSTAVVTITVNPAPLPPVANAGTAKTITLPENSVLLDGSKSTPGSGTIVSYEWTQIAGTSEALIATADKVSTNVTGLEAGVYQFGLEIKDNNGKTASATVTITVEAAPPPPVANAGNDQTITLPLNTVILNGSKSTAAAGSITKYEWTKVAGPAGGTIEKPADVTTNVTGLAEGVYQFQLKVTDNIGVSASAIVTVTVKAAPLPPVADAGDAQTITLPVNSVTLNAGKSTAPAGEIKTYVWTKTFGPAAGTITQNSSAVTTVTGLVAGTYQFQVKVTDNNNNTATAIVTITVEPAPVRPPVADAGEDFSVQLPTGNIKLNGTASYALDGTIVSYNWIKVSGPNPLTIVNSNTATPGVQFTQPGTYVFRLTITDSNGLTASMDVVAEVIAADVIPEPPVADAGDEMIVVTLPQREVMLDGSASHVSVGTIEKYEWKLVSGASGVQMDDPSSDILNVSGLNMGEYVFELSVTDSKGLTARDTVKVVVNNAGGKPDLSPHAKVFPNPVQSQAVIEVFGQANGRAIVDVYDTNGRKVLRTEFVKNDVYVNQKLDMSSLARGTYFIEIIIDYQYRTVVKAIKL
ncbi:MAG: T9SS type A sorting domain-containing protein [Chitinophagaceae bacterium]|nr:T9SS type A sorting domain-containing protein [Chitinophagaceae bacterium]